MLETRKVIRTSVLFQYTWSSGGIHPVMRKCSRRSFLRQRFIFKI